jgi:peptide-methionine (S)-S-oxide reductase
MAIMLRRLKSSSTASETSYRELLELFFQIHDPSRQDQQGGDRGASYRSAIFYTRAEHDLASSNLRQVSASFF